MRHLGRILGILLRVVLVTIILVTIGGGLVILRLYGGPLPLNLLTPAIETALSPPGGAFVIRVGDTVLTLDDDRKSLELATIGVRFEGRDGATLATIPRLTLAVSVEALWRGVLAPTRIIVEEPRVRLERDESGAFQFGIGGVDETGKDEKGKDETGNDADTGPTNAELTRQLVHDFLSPPYEGHPLSYLHEVRVRGGSLVVADHMLGAFWRAPRASALLQRVPGGVSGDFALAVAIADSTTELHGDFQYAIADHRLATQLGVAELDLSRLQRVAPMLAPLAGLELPISGTMETAVDTETSRLEGARLDLTVGAGTILDPALADGKLPLGGGALSASYDPAAGRLVLHQLMLDLKGPSVLAKATIDGVDAGAMLKDPMHNAGTLAVAADLSVRDMETDELVHYWPPDVARNAREWVTQNIHEGGVDEAHMSAALHLRPAAPEPDQIQLDKVGGGFTMHGLTVTYRAPLPPVHKVDGTATFDASTMTLKPTSGTLNGLSISAGNIFITGLDKKDQDIDIAVDVKGPLRDALEVLDSKPFQYAHEIGIDPAKVGGTASAKLSVKLPLEKKTTFEQVIIAARAQLADVALNKIVFDQDLSEGNLNLNLDRAGMKLDGTAKLAGLPSTIGWQQLFKTGKDGLKSRYSVRTKVDEEARRKLGLELQGITIKGWLGIEATVSNYGGGRGDVGIAYDADAATLSVADLDWSKPQGQPAKGKAQIDLLNDKIAAIREATLAGTGIDVRLAANFTRGDLQRLEVKRLMLGATDVNGVIARQPEGGWRINLQGPSLDASGFLTNLNKPGGERKDQPPLAIDGRIDRVILGPNRDATGVVLQLYSDGKHWQSMRVDAMPFARSTLKLRFGQAGGSRPFTFQSSSLGDMLLLLDISDHVADGAIEANGEATDEGAQRKFVGHIEGGSYRIVEAPVIAKLLALASFTSIGSLLAGEGIPFTKLQADFVAVDGKITLRKARTYGGAIGINAEGVVDLDGNTLDLQGTLVPAYTLNSILGNIPLIGSLLQGGEGQGLFAASFSAKGPLDNPQISVNPLTALAPGFLRNLFLPDAPSADGKSSAPGNGTSGAAKAPK